MKILNRPSCLKLKFEQTDTYLQKLNWNSAPKQNFNEKIVENVAFASFRS